MRTALTIFVLTALVTAQAPQEKLPTTPSGEPIYKLAPGNGIRPPRAIYTPEPDFSERARKKQIQGTVKISGYVGTDGKFHNAKVLQSVEKGLDDNALAVVQRWKFTPCTRDGQPVNCSTAVEISYNLYQNR